MVKMGKVSKGVKCGVEGCGKEAIRSLPVDKVTGAGMKVQGTRRTYLCKDHYKEYKKSTKKDRKVERWRFRG